MAALLVCVILLFPCLFGFIESSQPASIDFCAKNLCLNNATCHSLHDGFHCECRIGWTGEKCDLSVRNCEPSPCENGGTCVPGIANYICECPSGYEGHHCHKIQSKVTPHRIITRRATRPRSGSRQDLEGAQAIDTKEGDVIELKCRFNVDELRSQGFTRPTFLWRKRNRGTVDVVTFNEDFYEPSYILNHDLAAGKYDLTIRSANYDRDNYRFECAIKQSGSGKELESAAYMVTILIPAEAPRILPSNPVVIEGEPYQLRCLSEGGSPDPEIQWSRNGQLLDAEMKWGERKDVATEAILTISPSIDDHLAVYTCKVWNRAMREGERLEKSVTLNVNYAPRVEVGPFNPLMVLEGSDATMTCIVRANPPIITIEWYKDNKIISRHHNHTIINVGPSDSGVYSCVANNGIKPTNDLMQQSGRLELSVQYGPIISLASNMEANAGELIKIPCNVNSEPPAYSIVWTREDDSQIIQTGDVLTLNDVSPFESGRYFCSARNKIKPSGSNFDIEKSGKSMVSVKVKHAPGSSSIVPVDPVAVAGRPYTLTCSVKPPGYPKPKYRWWKEGDGDQDLSTTSQNHTFLSVHATHEGQYYCQPYNQIGKGSIANVYLTVRESPSITIKMPPQFRNKQGAKGFSLTCKARAKPKPSVIWLHNGQEVSPDSGLHRIETKEFAEDRDIYIIQTTLFFESASRLELTAADRGKYECVFNNGVEYPAKSETYLRIEHSPILQHTYNKVAFDVGETAILECKMSAYPEPRFEWFFGSKPLGIESRYIQNISEQSNDLWIGTLVIRDVRQSDYGDYTCRAWNSVGDDDKKTNIRLVAKSAPEVPRRLEIIEVLPDSVTLRWTEGFNGGFADTEILITFSDDGHRWRNESCRTMNPCKILGLESRREYRFKVMAINPRGQSQFSDEIRAQTKVNLADIPMAYDGYYDTSENLLSFRADQTALKLLARIEYLDGSSWSLITTAKVRSEIENIRLSPPVNGAYGDMRVTLCLQSNDSWCGYPMMVKMDVNSTYLREARSLSSQSVLIVVFILIAVILGMTLFCCCWKKRGDKIKKGDCEMDSDNNRNKVPSISPPYYSGHDNKGLAGSTDDTNKLCPPPMYTSSAMNSGNGHIPQNYYLTGDEGVVPSPSNTNETVHSEAWMMKNDHMNDVIDSGVMGYHNGYGSTPMDTNAFTYAYYSQGTDEYHPLGNDGYNINVKNSLYSPCYGDSLNAYGSTPARSNLMNDSLMDPQMLSQMDVSKINHLSFEDDPSYGGSGGGSRSGKMIKEIIV